MTLTQEAQQNIAFSDMMGIDKVGQIPVAQTREKINHIPPAPFAGLPPAMIITCQYDPLRDEGKAYAEKLRAAGVKTVYANYENVHGFLGIGEMGQQALQAVCDFLKGQM